MMRAFALSMLALSAPTLALLAYVFHLSRRKKSSRLPLKLVGRIASVERPLNPEGFVLIDGELWRARVRGEACVEGMRASVRVVGARGCALEVESLVPADLPA
jgi:membrane protein implicated in regulation of membrane protease activity